MDVVEDAGRIVSAIDGEGEVFGVSWLVDATDDSVLEDAGSGVSGAFGGRVGVDVVPEEFTESCHA